MGRFGGTLFLMTDFKVEKSAGITTLGLFLMVAVFLDWLYLGLASTSEFWTTAGMVIGITGFLLLLLGMHRALSSLDALASDRFPNRIEPHHDPDASGHVTPGSSQH